MRVETIFTVKPKPWKECSLRSVTKITACVLGILAILIGLFAILGDQKILLNPLERIGSMGGGIVLGTGVLLTLTGLLYCKKKPRVIEPEQKVGAKTIPIRVLFSRNPYDWMEFEVDPTRPLRELKLEIARRKGIPVTLQWGFTRLTNKDDVICSTLTLEFCKISTPTDFILEYYPGVNKRIKITVMIDYPCQFELGVDDPIKILKDQIYDLKGVLPENCDLIDEATGKPLEGEHLPNKEELRLKLVLK